MNECTIVHAKYTAVSFYNYNKNVVIIKVIKTHFYYYLLFSINSLFFRYSLVTQSTSTIVNNPIFRVEPAFLMLIVCCRNLEMKFNSWSRTH